MYNVYTLKFAFLIYIYIYIYIYTTCNFSKYIIVNDNDNNNENSNNNYYYYNHNSNDNINILGLIATFAVLPLQLTTGWCDLAKIQKSKSPKFGITFTQTFTVRTYHPNFSTTHLNCPAMLNC